MQLMLIALISFDKFLSLLPAGVQLFSLFNTNRQLIDLFIDIISSSDALSEYLSGNVQVLDAVIEVLSGVNGREKNLLAKI